MPVHTAEAASARLNFGKYLLAARERRGLSRADVVKSTKLPALLVGALEEGDPERWPERVFVVNALRVYAGAVGIDGDEAVSRFDQLPGTEQGETFDPQALERSRRARAMNTVLVLISLAALVALGLMLHSAWFFASRAVR